MAHGAPSRGLFVARGACCGPNDTRPAHSKDVTQGQTDDSRDDRRRNGGPGSDRPGRQPYLRLSRRRRAADLRRAVPAPTRSSTSWSATSRPPCMPPRAIARSTGKVGVVLVTSGPGATNAVTGLADALMDSIPVVCITGQVPTHLIGIDAFQECDTVGITRPCTKHNYLVKIDHRPAAHPARGVLRRRRRPAGPGGDRHPQGRAVRHRRLFAADQQPAQDLPPAGQGRALQDQGRRLR